jgi:hypothetical protein
MWAWVVSMFLLVNWIKFVLLRFSVNKLACNHLLIFWNTNSSSSLNLWKFFCIQIKFVSSANKIGYDMSLTDLGRSLIYNRNNNGPNTEPCGMPCGFNVDIGSPLAHILCFINQTLTTLCSYTHICHCLLLTVACNRMTVPLIIPTDVALAFRIIVIISCHMSVTMSSTVFLDVTMSF